jgi:hypothetical protein
VHRVANISHKVAIRLLSGGEQARIEGKDFGSVPPPMTTAWYYAAKPELDDGP